MSILENFNFLDFVVNSNQYRTLVATGDELFSYLEQNEEKVQYLLNLFMFARNYDTDTAILIIENLFKFDLFKPHHYRWLMCMISCTGFDILKLGKAVIEIFEKYGKIDILLEGKLYIEEYTLDILQWYCFQSYNIPDDSKFSEIIKYVIQVFTKYNRQMNYTKLDDRNNNIFHQICNNEEIVDELFKSICESSNRREIIDKILAVQDLPENIIFGLQSIRDIDIKNAQE